MPIRMKRVLAMRLALWGLVALMVVSVLAVRELKREPAAATQAGALYHGQTPEGLLTALAITDGKVHQAYLRWRMTCERGREPYVSTITFKPEYGDRFDHDGRRFTAGGRKTEDAPRGESVRYDVRVSGEVSGDRMSASGSGQTTETWMRNGRVTDVCRSERVPWTVHRGFAVRD
jgi:hypothetical protein